MKLLLGTRGVFFFFMPFLHQRCRRFLQMGSAVSVEFIVSVFNFDAVGVSIYRFFPFNFIVPPIIPVYLSNFTVFFFDECHHDKQYKPLLNFLRCFLHLEHVLSYDAIQDVLGLIDSNRYGSNRIGYIGIYLF